MAAKISQNSTKYQPSTRFFHVRCLFPCNLGHWIHFRWQKLFSPNGYIDGGHIFKMAAKMSQNSTKINRPLDYFVQDVSLRVIWVAEFISGDKIYFHPMVIKMAAIFSKWPPKLYKILQNINRSLDSFMWDVFFHVIWVAEHISGDKNNFRRMFSKMAAKNDIRGSK